MKTNCWRFLSFGKRLDTDFPFYLGGREVLIKDRPLRLFSNWFHYDPWHDEPENMDMSVEDLPEWEKPGKKKMLRAIASETYKAPFGEVIVLNGQEIPYPSDHGIVLTTFVLR